MKNYTPSREMNSFLDDLASLLNKYKADISPCADGKSIKVEMNGESAEFVAEVIDCDCEICAKEKLSN